MVSVMPINGYFPVPWTSKFFS